MRKSEKPGAPQRRIWRMTQDAPLGAFVDADEKADIADKPAAQPGLDELQPSSYVRSSWDLLNGLEVTEGSPDDHYDSLFDAPPRTVATMEPHERVQTASQWVRRFALRLAELDLQRDPKELIELAKRRWMTKHYLAPEEAADLEHRRR